MTLPQAAALGASLCVTSSMVNSFVLKGGSIPVLPCESPHRGHETLMTLPQAAALGAPSVCNEITKEQIVPVVSPQVCFVPDACRPQMAVPLSLQAVLPLAVAVLPPLVVRPQI